MIETFCNYHLGDQLVHLHYTRKLVERDPSLCFTHAAPPILLPQLYEVVTDLPQIKLIECDAKSDRAIDVWKNRKGDFYTHPKRDDWVAYHLEFFDALSRELGLDSPLQEARDFLFDYPAIIDNEHEDKFDFLIVNSPPLSNQCQGYEPAQMDRLIGILADKGFSVITTLPSGLQGIPYTHCTVTKIGGISLQCENIVGVATGPMWTTMNVWNEDTVALRVLLLEPERVNIAPRTHHANSVERAIGILIEEGAL